MKVLTVWLLFLGAFCIGASTIRYADQPEFAAFFGWFCTLVAGYGLSKWEDGKYTSYRYCGRYQPPPQPPTSPQEEHF